MNTTSKKYILSLIVSICLIFAVAANVSGETYEALKGVESVKAVFDFRVSSPKIAAVHLDLIHKTFKNRNLTAITKNPDFVVVFMGPAVKLISKNRESFSSEDQKHLDAIAGIIAKMVKDGIKVEVCVVAADLLGVDPASLLPEIKQVENGWISSIGYQHNGYALIPDF
jgi:intracellular sulfur oxidation DsrE/DsrF family protein